MKLWFHRALFWIWFKTHGYYLWSRFYRWAFERRWENQALTRYSSLEELEDALSGMRWDRDALKGKLDVISRPEKVEAIYRAADGDLSKALVGTRSGKWGHIGNWFAGTAQLGFESLDAIAMWWAAQANGTLIAWVIASPDLPRLRRLEVGDG